MTNEYIGPFNQHERGIAHFLFPLIFFGLSFYTLSWPINILLLICMLAIVGKEYLFAVYAGITFYNIMFLEGIPSWASLISSFGALAIIVLRIGVVKRKVPVSFFLASVLLVLILLSFVFKTIGTYFFLTGVKSSLQLAFLLLAIQAIILVPQKYFKSSKETFDKYLIPFILSYLAIGIFFFDFNDRFGAGTGPQVLALQLALIVCYLSAALPPRRNLQLFLLLPILFTGSRTYFFLACLILIYDHFRTSSPRLKVIIFANVVGILLLAMFLLPLTDSRFDYTSETFAGSFWGRFRNYEQGIQLIKEHPIAGNGMGSMLRVLEGWEYKEGFRYYQERGDTTIVHNEYLRILIELGLLGFTIILIGVIKIWRRLKSIGAKYIIVLFAIASLVENTLTLFTTGTLFFILLLAFANVPSQKEDVRVPA